MTRLSFAASFRRRAFAGARATIATAGLAALFAACEDDVPVVDPESNCEVEGNGLYRAVGFALQHYLPSRCPIEFGGPQWLFGGSFQQYEAVQTVGTNRGVPEGRSVLLDIYQANGQVKARQYPFQRWGDHLRADIVGDYVAATQAPPCTYCTWRDVAYQRVVVPDGIASAQVTLTYREVIRTSIQGPGGVGEGESFTLSASVSDNARRPVTYEWFVDGNSAAPASQTASSFSAYGNSGGTQQTYQVLVKDAVGGEKLSELHRVWVSYPETSGCDPTAIQCPE